MKIKEKLTKYLNKNKLVSLISLLQQKAQRFKKEIIAVIIVLSLVAMFMRGAANNFADGQRVILIEKDVTAAQIIQMLQEKELIPGNFAAKLYIRILNKDADLHSGRFVLPRNADIAEVMRILAEEGVVKNYIKVTIPEGKSIIEIVEILDENLIVPAKEMEAYLANLKYLEIKKNYKFLRDNSLSGQQFLEGYLFPDTYYFSQYSMPGVVINSMLKNFDNKTKQIFKDNYDVHKIITLASIVEKEAVKKEEQKLIAGIFIKRMEKEMTLGSCPTVKYALGRPHMKFLLYKHLEVDSPYNTYKYKGLPPGPICSPGLDAIKSVLDPEQSEYLYFVAKGDGTHQFSRTYQEHLRKQQQIGKIY